MSKLRPCLTCKPDTSKDKKFRIKRGFTRHDNQVCSKCRKYGPATEPINYRGRAA